MNSPTQIRVLAISGSLRTQSDNRKLLRHAMEFAAQAGAHVQEIDLKTLQLPMFDEDVESAGDPESVTLLKQAVRDADMLLIASPEYNYSIPGGLKNALDWASRDRRAFSSKTAAIFGSSHGPFGTIRMQPHLRQVLEALNVLMLPQPQVFVRSSRDAFSADGAFIDEKLSGQLRMLVDRTLALTKAMKA